MIFHFNFDDFFFFLLFLPQTNKQTNRLYIFYQAWKVRLFFGFGFIVYEQALLFLSFSYYLFSFFFCRCSKGDKCKYRHDPQKITVCRKFLRGLCSFVFLFFFFSFLLSSYFFDYLFFISTGEGKRMLMETLFACSLILFHSPFSPFFPFSPFSPFFLSFLSFFFLPTFSLSFSFLF